MLGKYKVVGSLLAASALLAITATPLGATTPAEGGRFWDDDGNTHEANIEAIANAGVTLGCVLEGTAFCPELGVTRAQMASFLARALSLSPVPGDRFSDVSTTSVHKENINAIAEADITFGCDSTGEIYCPNVVLNRAQMASFLARALNLDPVSSGPFTDLDGAPTHAQNINAIAADGITLGCDSTGTRYCPYNTVTRAQMGSFLTRGLDFAAIAVARAPRPIQLHDLHRPGLHGQRHLSGEQAVFHSPWLDLQRGRSGLRPGQDQREHRVRTVHRPRGRVPVDRDHVNIPDRDGPLRHHRLSRGLVG